MNRIKQLRIENGLTQDALAERTETMQEYISELERGIIPISGMTLGTARLFADALHCRLDDLLPLD